MKHDKNNPESAGHRTKGNKPDRRLAEEPEFKKLADLVDGQKIDKARTLEHIERKAKHEHKEET